MTNSSAGNGSLDTRIPSEPEIAKGPVDGKPSVQAR